MNLQLHPVPKMLGKIKEAWNPKTTLISFKLETDDALLEKKAKGAIQKYGVDMVVANILNKRRREVTIYHQSGEKHDLRLEEEGSKVDEISKQIIAHVRDALGITAQEAAQKKQDEDEQKKEEELYEQEGYTKHKIYDRKVELFVSNIGFETDEEILKSHFSMYGKLVKVKIIKRNNKSTGRAFIEYFEEEHCKKAKEEMNNSYLGAKKLCISFAGDFEDHTKSPYPDSFNNNKKPRYNNNKGYNRGSQGGYGNYGHGYYD
mmetsp:Transcript_35925/g.55170  ORF Transcript_35925/g.55170 Transcript_35925/m.55170 type:complete len:261 (-) Transcript_35925:1086-1868(-)